MGIINFKELESELKSYNGRDDHRYNFLTPSFTEYESFLKVVEDLNFNHDDKALVLGSSIGTIPFYFKHHYGIDSIGVEYMECRVNYANNLREKYKIDGVDFIKLDIKNYEINNDITVVWVDNKIFKYKLTNEIYKTLFNKKINFICYVEPQIDGEFELINKISKEGWSNECDHFIIKFK